MFIWPFWLVAQWLKRSCLVFLFGGKENVTTSDFNIGFCSIPITAQILSLLRNYPRSRFPFLSRRCSDKPSHFVAIEHMPQYSFTPFEPWGFSNSSGAFLPAVSLPGLLKLWLGQIHAAHIPSPCSRLMLGQPGPLSHWEEWAEFFTSEKGTFYFCCKPKLQSIISEMAGSVPNENSQMNPVIR